MTWKVRGRGYSFIPFLFGLACLGAIGFYQQVGPCPNGQAACSFQLSRFTVAMSAAGLSPLRSGNSDGAGIYWLVAIPATLILAVGFFFVRRGPQPVWRLIPVAIGGFVFLATLIGLGFRQSGPGGIFPGDFTIRGLVGLVVLSLTMLVMAVVERNGTLALLSAGAVGVAFLANLYDIENVTGDFGSSSTTPNLIVPAIYFLLAAVILAVPDVIGLVRSGGWRSPAGRSKQDPAR